MIKIDEQIFEINGERGQILIEFAIITRCVHEELKKTMPEKRTKKFMERAFEFGIKSQEEIDRELEEREKKITEYEKNITEYEKNITEKIMSEILKGGII